MVLDAVNADESLKGKLDDAVAASKKGLDWSGFTDGKEPDEQASLIVDGLNAILRFQSALQRKVKATTFVADADAKNGEARSKAQADVDQVLGGVVKPLLAERRATVKDYSAAIGLIGEALN